MLTPEELASKYMRAALAGLELQETTTKIHFLIQKGRLDGVNQGGRWYATIQSVKALKAERAASLASGETHAPRGLAAAH